MIEFRRRRFRTEGALKWVRRQDMDAGHADECPAGSGGTGGARRRGPPGWASEFWSWRPADGSLNWSDGVHALLQLPPDQPASWECWLKQVHPDDQDMVRRTLLPPACDREHAQTLDYRLIRSDGSTIRIEDRRQMDVDGTCQGVFIDVTPDGGDGLGEPAGGEFRPARDGSCRNGGPFPRLQNRARILERGALRDLWPRRLDVAAGFRPVAARYPSRGCRPGQAPSRRVPHIGRAT